MVFEGFGYNGIFIPIALAILSIFLIGVFIKESIIEGKLLKGKLSFGVLIAFSLLVICLFYKEISKNETLLTVFNWSFVGYTIIIGVTFYFSINVSMDKKRIYNQYIKCIESSYYFVFLDKKGKIKDMSASFEKIFNVSLKEAKKLPFAEVLFDNFQVEYINDTKVSKEDFKSALEDLSGLDKPVKMEILGFDSNKGQMLLNLTDKPLFTSDKFYGHVIYGNIRNERQMSQTEVELDSANDELEMIKMRFLANIDLSSEAMFSVDLKKGNVWGNDAFAQRLNLPSNSMSYADFINYIAPEDQQIYKEMIKSLDQNNTDYETTYRFKTGNDYSYVKDKGRKLFLKDRVELIGFIDTIRSKKYDKTNIKELDEIKTLNELYSDAIVMYTNNKIFQVVTYRITNIPDINKKFGRDLANQVMADYLKASNDAFVDNEMLYRVSGLDFAFIVSDPRKMDRLHKALERGVITKIDNDYGNYNVHVEVNLGIATSRNFMDAKATIKASQRALDIASSPQVQGGFIYYEDIKR